MLQPTAFGFKKARFRVGVEDGIKVMVRESAMIFSSRECNTFKLF